MQTKRTHKKEWDFRNLRTISTKIPTEEYLIFQRELEQEGTTAYAVIQKLVHQWRLEHPLDPQPSKSQTDLEQDSASFTQIRVGE